MSTEKPKYSRKEGKDLIDEEVVLPINIVKEEARKIAKALGKDVVPEEMLQDEPLEGKIIGYDEKTRKYQVQVDKAKVTLYIFRNEFIVAKKGMEDLKLTAELNRPNSDTESDEEELVEKQEENMCWDGYVRVKGTRRYAKGSCRKKGSGRRRRRRKVVPDLKF